MVEKTRTILGINFSLKNAQFLKAHLSLVIAPLILLLFALLLLPSILRTDSREFTKEIKGQLSSLQIVRGGTSAQNYFIFTVKEFTNQFKLSGISEVDQALLSTEKQNTEITFSVEESRFAKGPDPIPVTSFATARNSYLDGGNTAELIKKSRGFLIAVVLVLILASVFSITKAMSKYREPITEGLVPFDPMVLLIARHPILAFSVSLLILLVVFELIVPAFLIRYIQIVFLICYLSFIFWFRKYGSQIVWIKTVIEAQKMAANERTTTAAPKHVKAVNMLIKSGKDINIQDGKGRTALHISAQKGNVEAVDLLIRSGAKLDVKDKEGVTPIMLAAEKGMLGLVVKFVQNGANLLLLNNNSENPLMVAEKNKKNRGVIEFLTKATAKAQVEAEAKAKAEEEAKAKAQEQGDKEILVRAGIEVDKESTDPTGSNGGT